MVADRRQPAFNNLLAYQVTSTADALRRGAAMRMRREHDMSLAQIRTLALIEHLQPVRLRDVAADAGSDKAQVSRVVSSLVGRGYVSRRALPGDARSAHLELTETGHAKMGDVTRSIDERDNMLRTALQPGEADQLTALLAVVRRTADGFALEEEQLDKTQRESARRAA